MLTCLIHLDTSFQAGSSKRSPRHSNCATGPRESRLEAFGQSGRGLGNCVCQSLTAIKRGINDHTMIPSTYPTTVDDLFQALITPRRDPTRRGSASQPELRRETRPGSWLSRIQSRKSWLYYRLAFSFLEYCWNMFWNVVHCMKLN